MNKPLEEIRSIQEQELRQFIVDCRNPQGVQALLKEYQLSGEEVERLVQNILRDIARERPAGKGNAKIQFDIGTGKFLAVDEWVKKYVLPRI
ncbi:MAG: hypothetical protein HXY45_02360 [Syntrophaceae bacterium]|nr:hypothetical protein [Syntrophaceae bacterium]